MAQISETNSHDLVVTIEVPIFTKKDILFVLLLLLLLFGVGTLLIRDLYYSSQQVSGNPVAKLAFRENRVERKIGGKVIWSTIGAPDEIYNYDSIRTDGNSQAKLTLNTGTELTLSNTALVTVIVDESGMSFDLGGPGDIAVNSNGDQSSISIKSVNGILRLENGGNAKLSQGENGLSVDVFEGNAVFEDTEGATSTVSQHQSFVQNTDGSTAVSDVSFRLIKPKPFSYLLSLEDKKSINFTWQSDAIGATTIEISPAADFSRNVQSYAATAKTFETELGDGNWYWRVGNGEQLSSVAQFVIIRDQRPGILAPDDGSTFYYVGKPPLILLQWQSSKNITSHKVKIFDAENELVREFSVQNFFIALDDLPEGDYVWQVEGVSQAYEETIKSVSSSFRVQKFSEGEVPDPKIHLEDVISEHSLGEEGLIIKWDSVGELGSYLTELTKGDEILYSEVVKKNYTTIPPGLVLGEYNVAVTALSGTQEISSEEHDFDLVEFLPIKIIEPAANAEFLSDNPGLKFFWEDDNRGSKYRIELSGSSTFEQISFQKETEGSFLSIPTPDVGSYYARVSLILEEGARFPSSVPLPFKINEKLRPGPIVTGPVALGSIDITVHGTLKLSWESVLDTDFYRLVIIPAAAPASAISRNVSGLSWAAKDPFYLPLGLYNYTLTSFANNENGGAVENSETTSGSFYLRRSKLRKVSKVEIF